MDFDMAAVERDLPRRVRISSDCSENVLPNSSFAPPREAVVDRLMRPILARTILPPASRAQHVHDAAQNPSIVFSFRPTLVGWQMQLYFHPLVIAEPKQALIHRLAPSQLTKPLNQHMVN
jgi:hypothetical protein